jgi:quercetin dioxygenase-like cupin family protein
LGLPDLASQAEILAVLFGRKLSHAGDLLSAGIAIAIPVLFHTSMVSRARRRMVDLGSSGCGAAWLARLLGVQEVPGSNPGSPTNSSKTCSQQTFPNSLRGVHVESKMDAQVNWCNLRMRPTSGGQIGNVGLPSSTEGELMVTGTSEEIRIGQLAIRFLVEGGSSGGSVAVFEFDVPAGARVPIAHSHDAYEETIYGLEGVLTWTVDGQQNDVGPGEVLCIRRGAVHRFDNGHGLAAKMLAIVSPGILGPGYFREMAAVINAAAGGPPDPAALTEVMRRHGLTPAP